MVRSLIGSTVLALLFSVSSFAQADKAPPSTHAAPEHAKGEMAPPSTHAAEKAAAAEAPPSTTAKHKGKHKRKAKHSKKKAEADTQEAASNAGAN